MVQIDGAEPRMTEKTASVLSSTSTHVDPAPHYIMSAAMAGAAMVSYFKMANPTAAMLAGGISAGYFLAARYIETGSPKVGYDLGTFTSAALVAATAPLAVKSNEGYSTALSVLGGVSLVGNGLKSYQARTGRPRE